MVSLVGRWGKHITSVLYWSPSCLQTLLFRILDPLCFRFSCGIVFYASWVYLSLRNYGYIGYIGMACQVCAFGGAASGMRFWQISNCILHGCNWMVLCPSVNQDVSSGYVVLWTFSHNLRFCIPISCHSWWVYISNYVFPNVLSCWEDFGCFAWTWLEVFSDFLIVVPLYLAWLKGSGSLWWRLQVLG